MNIEDSPFTHTNDPAEMAQVDEQFSNVIDFESVIQPDKWQAPGEYYRSMPAKTHQVVAAVVEGDTHLRRDLREAWFPTLLKDGDLLAWSQADPHYIDLIQRKRLAKGQVVAADGTISRYQTLSLVGAQIGISRVSYQGHTGQIAANLMC